MDKNVLWIHQPNVLWVENYYLELIPCEDYCRNRNVNAIVRFCIIGIILVTLLGKERNKATITYILFLIIVSSTYYSLEEEKKENQNIIIAPPLEPVIESTIKKEYDIVPEEVENTEVVNTEVENTEVENTEVENTISDYFTPGLWGDSDINNAGLTQLSYGGSDGNLNGTYLNDIEITTYNSIYDKNLYKDVNDQFNTRQQNTSETRIEFDAEKQKEFASWLYDSSESTLKESGVNSNWTFNSIQH